MSRLTKPPKPPRSPFAPRLTPEQETARLAQSKADRRKIVFGIVMRGAPVTRNGLPVWGGLRSRGTPRNGSAYVSPFALRGAA